MSRLVRFRDALPSGGRGSLRAEPLREDPGIVHFAENLLRLLEPPRRLGRAVDERAADLGRIAKPPDARADLVQRRGLEARAKRLQLLEKVPSFGRANLVEPRGGREEIGEPAPGDPGEVAAQPR